MKCCTYAYVYLKIIRKHIWTFGEQDVIEMLHREYSHVLMHSTSYNNSYSVNMYVNRVEYVHRVRTKVEYVLFMYSHCLPTYIEDSNVQQMRK